MSFKFLNEGRQGDALEITPTETFIDPVSKIRVSNPSNLIDTDFEYGLQPTKWETVEIINNTPAFFSRSGDTTIPDITGVITNADTREITVTTAFPHNLAVGIPIRVSGTKSLTADGSYIINATPSANTFTYLAIAPQAETVSIFDLYTSIITGEFFQGSQITVDDAEGITTSTEEQSSNSVLTVKTPTKHGFGLNTPFYFLNLNSTISQEFESQNATSLSFDPTNSATAQQFDGSNTLLQTPIDLSNSATTSTVNNTITSTDPGNATITVSINAANEGRWAALKVGDPLYYSVTAGSGYFQNNPRGVVFIKNIDGVNASNLTATFQVSELPNGTNLPIVAGMSGNFLIADRGRTFAGNNVDAETQIDLTIEVGQEFEFDGGNQGYVGEDGSETAVIPRVFGFQGSTINLLVDEGTLSYYPGAMLEYFVEDSEPSAGDAEAATGLVDGRTYFVLTFDSAGSPGLFTMTIAELPGGNAISPTGGAGIQKFKQIGVALDKNIVHIKDSNFDEKDMIEYVQPENGKFVYDSEEANKKFFFVKTAYDEHNYELEDELFVSEFIIATGGDLVYEIWQNGRAYRVHEFTTVGESTFEVQSIGETDGEVEYLVVAGGGGGGGASSVASVAGGGGGAGGYRSSVQNEQSGGGVAAEPLFFVNEESYVVEVGAGGSGRANNFGLNGGDSRFGSIVAKGGGGGGFREIPGGGTSGEGAPQNSGQNGGSGGGASYNAFGGTSETGQGFSGGNNGGGSSTHGGGGGGGASSSGASVPIGQRTGGVGGNGLTSNITGTPITRAGGGGGGVGAGGSGSASGGSGGGGEGSPSPSSPGAFGIANTGGGGGGAGSDLATLSGGNGGSGIVIIRYPITPVVEDIISASGGEISLIVLEDDQ